MFPSQFGALATEQTKQQLRLQIILEQMRCLRLQNKSLPRAKEKTASQAILGSTAGISACVRPSMQLKNGRALGSQGSRRGSRRRQHQQAPATRPRKPEFPAAASRSRPGRCARGFPPALARVPAPAVRLQRPGIARRRGYRKAPHRGPAGLPSPPLAGARAPG